MGTTHAAGLAITATNTPRNTTRLIATPMQPWQGRTTGQGSTRASRAARLKCLQDAGYRCQISYEGCTGHATHADHKVNIASTGQTRRDATNPDDLQAACAWCHGIKTQREARAARTYRSNRRAPERHPGLL